MLALVSQYQTAPFEDPAADAMARQWALTGSALASLALGDWQECRRASLAGADIGRHAGDTQVSCGIAS